MFFLIHRYLSIYSTISLFYVNDFPTAEANCSNKQAQYDETNHHSRDFSICNCIGLSKISASFVTLHNTGLGMNVGVTISTFLPVLLFLVNLKYLICWISIIVRVKVVLEIVSFYRICVYFIVKHINMFPPQFIRVLHVIIVCWVLFGEVRTYFDVNAESKFTYICWF